MFVIVALFVAVDRRWLLFANADDVCGCSLFVVWRVLFVVCCCVWTDVACCWLLRAGCCLFCAVVCWSLFVARCLLFVVGLSVGFLVCWLIVLLWCRWSMFVVCCGLFAA